MKNQALIPVYAITLLLSAALLFSIQPMFSKMILPLLGGTPQVWNTAMLFFQVVLLGGYAYAHGTSKYLSVRLQALLHICLLVIFVFILPFGIPAGWEPPSTKDPTVWQITLMVATIGGPFFVLSGSAPMLQRWFSLSAHKEANNPYFLYGASNLGSMSSLFAYPIIIEPLLTLNEQASVWMYGYLGLVLFISISAILVWKRVQTTSHNKALKQNNSLVDTELGLWRQRISWIILAFIPSSLMLGVTTFLTTDIASVPLLWILPLALYVGTFIIVFSRAPCISPTQSSHVFGICVVILVMTHVISLYTPFHPVLAISVHMVTFFFAALTCHSELAYTKPKAERLTEFYLIMSLGGALGGFFNAIIAPVALTIPLEYGLILIFSVFVRYAHQNNQNWSYAREKLKSTLKERSLDFVFTGTSLGIALIFLLLIFFAMPIAPTTKYCLSGLIGALLLIITQHRWLFGFTIAAILMLFPLGYNWDYYGDENILHHDRNFFGVIKVADDGSVRTISHGTTMHGTQLLDPENSLIPVSYYSHFSPLNDAMEYLDRTQSGKHSLAVIGLGIGVIACYTQEGRTYDFYEIDPDIAAIAANPLYFTMLSDCGSPFDIILGDGRLTIQKKDDQAYAAIILDAFSSDNIPIHLITTEAIQLYQQKLDDNGFIIIHISNNYLDLEPVLTKNAEALGMISLAKYHDGKAKLEKDLPIYSSHWVVLTTSNTVADNFRAYGWSDTHTRQGVKAWTDQYSNIISVFGNLSGKERYRQAKENAAIRQ